MSEQTATPETASDQGAPQPPRLQVLSQFIRDLSFENAAAQRRLQGEVQPDVNVNVTVEPRRRPESDIYEVTIKLRAEARNKVDDAVLFLLEVDYPGLFRIENVPDEQLLPFLMIECPRMTFPFLRRIVHDITRDGGFPPLNLENIDFVALFRAEVARQQKAAAQQPAN